MDERVTLPDNPTTAVLVRQEAIGRSDIFAFVIGFPRNDKVDGTKGVQLTIQSRPIKDHESLSSELAVAKGYATKVIDALLERGRTDLIHFTNWPSVVASIARLIDEFEEKRLARRTSAARTVH